jgi:hypothetical protein
LHDLLASSAPWDDRTVAAQLPRAQLPLPALVPVSVNLSEYDQLLMGPEVRDVTP